MCLVLIWAARGTPFLRSVRTGRIPYRLTSEGSLALGVCALMGAGGVYYATFGIFLLLCAGICSCVRALRWRKLVPAAALASIIFASLFLNLLPNIVNRLEHGNNPDAAIRTWMEGDTYSLRIATLLLPQPQHRIQFLRELTWTYLTGDYHVLRVQDSTVPLGAVGAAGFLFLLAWIALGQLQGRRDELLGTLGALNLAALLLTTAGSFGVLISYALSPQTRVYNRISVFIAFFAFTAVVAALDRVQRHWFAGAAQRFHAIAALALLAGVWDLTPAAPAPEHYKAIAAQCDADRLFIGQIEAAVPREAMIYQLPYVVFPEAGDTNAMLDYDHLRGFLYSETLHWSYAAIRGRPGDVWQKETAKLPAPQLVEKLAAAGFKGIYIDRYGYADRAKQLCDELTPLLGVAPMESADGRFAFFRLAPYAARRRAAGEAVISAAAALHLPVAVSFQQCSSDNPGNYWCPYDAEIVLENSNATASRVHLAAHLTPATPQPAKVMFSEFVSETLAIAAPGSDFAADVTVTPGRHSIRLHCDGKRLLAPNDPRILVFAVTGAQATEIE